MKFFNMKIRLLLNRSNFIGLKVKSSHSQIFITTTHHHQIILSLIIIEYILEHFNIENLI